MRTHWRYGKYVAWHKLFVFLAGLRLGVPLWQLIVHDYTKFLPSEWFPYAAYFYSGKETPDLDAAFDIAWLHHQKRNPHHWQYWLLTKDTGETFPIPMPDRFMREMVADWMGAGRALGKPDTAAWYRKNADKMQLAPWTRERVELLLEVHA